MADSRLLGVKYLEGRNFRWKNFGQIREIKIPYLTPENLDSRKLIPAKFLKLAIREKLIPTKCFKN